MPYLSAEPHPTDIAAWRKLVETLQAEPQGRLRDRQLETARVHLDALEAAIAQERAGGAPSR